MLSQVRKRSHASFNNFSTKTHRRQAKRSNLLTLLSPRSLREDAQSVLDIDFKDVPVCVPVVNVPEDEALPFVSLQAVFGTHHAPHLALAVIFQGRGEVVPCVKWTEGKVL